MVRITGGTLRGRTLKTLRGRESRPTLSRVREAVFNILGDEIRGARFLDLFSGAGTMGVEALSRGAGDAVFVERSRRCGRVLAHNLAALGLEERARVICANALEMISAEGIDSEVVFADPPYASGDGLRVLERLGRLGGKARTRWVVIQHGVREIFPEAEGFLRQVRSRRYGETAVEFYQPQ